jgi:hypothetical protein
MDMVYAFVFQEIKNKLMMNRNPRWVTVMIVRPEGVCFKEKREGRPSSTHATIIFKALPGRMGAIKTAMNCMLIIALVAEGRFHRSEWIGQGLSLHLLVNQPNEGEVGSSMRQ